jgi:2-C-methyl-D-erythritol 4-phosphate cytidylyltransferase
MQRKSVLRSRYHGSEERRIESRIRREAVTVPYRVDLPKAAGIVLAAGSGTRFGAEQSKVFLPLAGRRVFTWSLRSFAQIRSIHRLVLVIRDIDRDLTEQTLEREVDDDIHVEIVTGGDTRHESELAALRYLAPAISDGSINIVLLHDGARPIIPPSLVRALIKNAARTGAVIPGMRYDDIRPINPDGTIQMLPAPQYVGAQTPQVFNARAILSAYEQAARDQFIGTDTMSCYQHYHPGGGDWIPGDPRNLKITYPDDLFEAEKILHETNFHIE